jgi:hypothetical protein
MSDLVLDYAGTLVHWLGELGIFHLYFQDFAHFSDDEQRVKIRSLQEEYAELYGETAPESDDIRDFLNGGPRPPTTG